MSEPLNVFIGYDERERVGFHVCASSILRRTSADVVFHMVRGKTVVGSTQFNPGRFDIARRMGYRGWALWCEADMLFLADIEELFSCADSRFDVLVVKHDYRTKHPVKFLGQPNPDYPMKNWSSLMLVNCQGAAWERMRYRDYLLEDLHRFRFLDEARIGALPAEWNWLVGEYPHNPGAKVAHHTIGIPAFPEYRDCDYAVEWFAERQAMLEVAEAECAQAA